VRETQSVLSNLYEGLVTFDAEMSLQPGLAVSWTNPDDLTLDLRIRPDVRFQTGDPLTADDVVFSLERARTHPRSVLRAALANVAGVTASGSGRVRITTRTPDASLLPRLRQVFVASRRFVEARGESAFASASAGTGAYRLVAREAGATIDLDRFDGYWRGPARFAHARFVVKSAPDSFASPLVPAGARVVFSVPAGSPEYVKAASTAVPHHHPGLAILYLGFDLRDRTPPGLLGTAPGRNPFLALPVREAIARAIDLSALREKVAGGHGAVPSQLVPRSILGFDPTVRPPRASTEEARALLSTTPFASGFGVTLDVRRFRSDVSAFLGSALAPIGLRLEPRVREDRDFFQHLSSGASALFVLRFFCWTGDAQELLDDVVHSRDESRGLGEFNFSYEKSPIAGLDEEIEACRRELVPEVRLRKLQAAMHRVMDARLVLPLLEDESVLFAPPDVSVTPRADSFVLAWEVGVMQ
jgi:peptide/nickel transport system substrate-binding protein